MLLACVAVFSCVCACTCVRVYALVYVLACTKLPLLDFDKLRIQLHVNEMGAANLFLDNLYFLQCFEEIRVPLKSPGRDN